MKQRLDKEMNDRGLCVTRSQAESLIKMGRVWVDRKIITKPGHMVSRDNKIKIKAGEQFVSRAAYKLQSAVEKFDISFKDRVVLDVGSSTGGFTDYALRYGANKVIAVDVGTDQLHPSLRGDERIELHEKTDIRDIEGPLEDLDIVLIDVSFISLREILPHIKELVAGTNANVIAMVKPQFEAGKGAKHKGVIKNDRMRREIMKDFEKWVRRDFVIIDKADSKVSGSKGNVERFYLLEAA